MTSKLKHDAKFLFIAPVLKHIAEGRLFSRVFATVVRVFAALFALAGLIEWFRSWRAVFTSGSGIFGGLVVQIALLIGIYMTTHILWYRASEIADQPASDFTVIPIVSIFFRMVGEMYACLLLVFGLCGGILILSSQKDTFGDHGYWMPSGLFFSIFDGASFDLFRHVEHLLEWTDSPFLAAALFIIICVVTAFIALVVFYLLAECILVFVDIARNIRAMRRYYEPAT